MVARGPPVKFREIERMKRLLASGRLRGHRCYFDACRSVMVAPGGDAYPCASLSALEFCLGNVCDDDFGDHLGGGLAKAKKTIGLPSRCLCCEDLGLCGGAVPGRDLSYAGDVECAVRKVYIRHAREK